MAAHLHGAWEGPRKLPLALSIGQEIGLPYILWPMCIFAGIAVLAGARVHELVAEPRLEEALGGCGVPLLPCLPRLPAPPCTSSLGLACRRRGCRWTTYAASSAFAR